MMRLNRGWFSISLIIFAGWAALFINIAVCTGEMREGEEAEFFAGRAAAIANDFFASSIEQRLSYEYRDEFFCPDERGSLYVLASEAREQMGQVLGEQELLKKRIEDYSGTDWEDRFGKTGLWRKVYADICVTELLKCRVDYYVALAGPAERRERILYGILEKINLLPSGSLMSQKQYLRVKVSILLWQNESASEDSAREQLELILGGDEIDQREYFEAAIEKIKMDLAVERANLEELVRRFAGSGVGEDFELNVRFALLLSRYGMVDEFLRICRKKPDAGRLVGRIIWADLVEKSKSNRLGEVDFGALDISQVELAVEAGVDVNDGYHGSVLERLAALKQFQSAAVLYRAGLCAIKRRPDKAVDLLIRAGRAQYSKGEQAGQLKAEEFARQGAMLGYELFVEDSNNCDLAVRSLGEYCDIAGSYRDERLEYLYAQVLSKCGYDKRSAEQLQGIAACSGHSFRANAQYDLIVNKLKEVNDFNSPAGREVLMELEGLVTAGTDTDAEEGRIYRDAAVLYCRLELEHRGMEGADNVLRVLSKINAPGTKRLNVLRSAALSRLGRMEEAAEVMVRAIDANSCEEFADAAGLVLLIADRIDERMDDAGFERLAENAAQLSWYCYNCCEEASKRQFGLLYAELAILAAGENREKLTDVEVFLRDSGAGSDTGDMSFLRCRARLARGQGRFGEAAQNWVRISEILKIQEGIISENRSWYWWRAKFGELWSWSQMPGTDRGDVLHNIEVLQNSFSNVPEFWLEKLVVLYEELKGKIEALKE
ncbi:MAG: hypothetical protein ABIG61_02980 [Planctomycetota bacterium]